MAACGKCGAYVAVMGSYSGCESCGDGTLEVTMPLAKVESMRTDLRYAMQQLNVQCGSYAVLDARSRARDALERVLEALEVA
jgi:hypothetical protein